VRESGERCERGEIGEGGKLLLLFYSSNSFLNEIIL